MSISWYRVPYQLFTINMMGHPVESNNDDHAFLVSTAALSFIGWIYLSLIISERLRFFEAARAVENRNV